MDGFLRQSTASQSRLIGPFLDDTDFKTEETALTIANTDIKLRANGTTLANKNSGGGTTQALGHYSVTWDATDTANVGELKYFVKVAGALPVWGSYVVLEEAVYDAIYASGASGFGVAQTGDSFARLGAPAGASIAADIATRLAAASYTTPPTVGAIADQVWDEILSGHLTAGSAGAALNGAGGGGGGDPWLTELPGVYAEGTAGWKLGQLPDVIAGGEGGLTIGGPFGEINANLVMLMGSIEAVVELMMAIDQIPGIVSDLIAVKGKTDTLPSAVQRGVALPNFGFPMVDADGNMLTGLTVSGLRRKDNGPFESLLNPIIEVGERIYSTDIAAADLDADMVVLKFTAPGAVPRIITIKTEP